MVVPLLRALEGLTEVDKVVPCGHPSAETPVCCHPYKSSWLMKRWDHASHMSNTFQAHSETQGLEAAQVLKTENEVFSSCSSLIPCTREISIPGAPSTPQGSQSAYSAFSVIRATSSSKSDEVSISQEEIENSSTHNPCQTLRACA